MKIEIRRTVTKHIRIEVPLEVLHELIDEHLRHLADDDPNIPNAIDSCADEDLITEDGEQYDLGFIRKIVFEWKETVDVEDTAESPESR